jgi:hypothetical protein
MNLQDVKPGDFVTRMLCGTPMQLKVSEVTDDRIVCGPWKFCKKTGAEIDEDLGWGRSGTGSFLQHDGIGKTVHVAQKEDASDGVA